MALFDPLDVVAKGLLTSRRRLQQTDLVDDRLRAAVAVTEVAVWTTAVADIAKQGVVAIDERCQVLLDGIRWARNRGLHQLLALATIGEGRSVAREGQPSLTACGPARLGRTRSH